MRVPKLKVPLWQELVYLALVGLGPIIITCMELFQSRSVLFKISFASVGSIFITYYLIRKFILNDKIDKLKQRIVLLEHDYSIANGNPVFIKKQWKTYSSILYFLNAIQALLVVVIFYMFITAILKQVIAFRGASVIILSMVLLGMAFKALCYITIRVEGE